MEKTPNNATRAVEMAVAHIVPAKDNVHSRERKTSDTMRGLVDSIRASGIIHRIVVRPDGDRYVIVDGHRRFEAAKLAGLGVVPVEIRETDESDAIAVTIAANVQRLENDPILEAEAIEKLLAAGKDMREIAASIGKDEGYVARRARLTALTKPWREFAKRQPCTADMLERVAAYEPQMQDAVAAEVELAEYEVAEGETCRWAEFEQSFRSMLRCISDAKFDTADCASCPNNTGCHKWLFPEMQDELARCQDPKCYARRTNEAVDATLDSLKRRGRPAIEVAEKWAVPQYWEASEKPNGRHPQAYVWTEGDVKRLMWSVPRPAAQKTAPTPEEKAAAKEAKRKAAIVKGARDKLRRLIEPDGETDELKFFTASDAAGNAFDRIAANRLERELRRGWISDEVCDDVMREFSHGIESTGALTHEEIAEYRAAVEETANG